MKAATKYSTFDLEYGTCRSCGEVGFEILRGDGRCIDCIEEHGPMSWEDLTDQEEYINEE